MMLDATAAFLDFVANCDSPELQLSEFIVRYLFQFDFIKPSDSVRLGDKDRRFAELGPTNLLSRL